MCIRSKVKLGYGERARRWCVSIVNANVKKSRARTVDCQTFTERVRGCRTVQQSANLVSFYQGDSLIGQTVWSEDDLQFRLMDVQSDVNQILISATA